jgi:hypothetical protein
VCGARFIYIERKVYMISVAPPSSSPDIPDKGARPPPSHTDRRSATRQRTSHPPDAFRYRRPHVGRKKLSVIELFDPPARAGVMALRNAA